MIALDETERCNPVYFEAVQEDPSLDPTNVVDEPELEVAGVELDGGLGIAVRLGHASTSRRAAATM